VLGLCGLLLAGCDETVGFLSIDLEVPTRTPPISCAGDPRRVVALSLVAVCDGGTVSTSQQVAQGTAASVSLSQVPLGSCTLEVRGQNLAGRVVLSGKEAVSVERGENPPLKISLLEERCEEKACDSDGDGLADLDEPALGTDPSRADTDGDGLEDGLEVQQCCSDPRLPGGTPCKLLIQRVEPLLGVVGESVMVKASAPLVKPEVELGRVALADPLADSTIVFGRVGAGAVLGEVRLTSAGVADTYVDLFAVLHEPTQTVAELDQRAGAKLGLMQDLADATTIGDVQILVGTAGWPSTVLVLSDRRNNLHVRIALSSIAKPVAVTGAEKLAVVLLRDASEQTVIQAVDLSPAKLRAPIQGLAKATPVAIALEPGGATALVLYKNALQRIRLDANAASAAVTLTGYLGESKPTLPLPDPGLLQKAGCSGLTYRQLKTATGVEGWVFAACNAPPLACPAGVVCEESAHLLRLGPLEKCLPLDGKQPPAASAGSACWARLAAKGFGRALGSPVVDEVGGQVYQLTAAGVLAGPLSGFVAGAAIGALGPILPIRFEGKASSPRMMVLDGAGRLYAADGPRVWRVEVRKPDPKRPARPFLVGRGGEEALSLGLSGDGSLLDLGRVKEGSLSSLASVCLERCAECLCGPQ
jgi:hypothetical protein